MISLRLSQQKIFPVVAALSVLTLSACSEEARAPLTDEQITAVKERLAPVASVTVAGKSAAAPAKAAPEPIPAASAPAAPEAAPAPSPSETPAAEPAESTAPAAEPAESTAPEAESAEAPATVETTPSVPVEAVPAAPAASDTFVLATNNGCMACHKIDVLLVGPAYKDVSAKYKDDSAALDMLVAKVKAGGVGVWGQIPMPPNAHVSDADITTIVTWVLTQ